MRYDMQQKLPNYILTSFLGCGRTFNDVTQTVQTNFYKIPRYWFQSKKPFKIFKNQSTTIAILERLVSFKLLALVKTKVLKTKSISHVWRFLHRGVCNISFCRVVLPVLCMWLEITANVLYLNNLYVSYYIFHTVYVYLYISLDINHVRVPMYNNFL